MTSAHGADYKHLLTGPMMVACQWNTAENRKQKLGNGEMGTDGDFCSRTTFTF